MLVEQNLERGRELSRRFHVSSSVASIDDLPDGVDAAIVAAPNYLHRQLTCQLLERGIAVLVEKPMACNLEDCLEMIEVAQRSQRSLEVAMVRRHCLASRWLDQAFKIGLIGKLQSVEVREGNVFDWPIQSPALFQPARSGGGVVMDIGVHVLDLLDRWFGPGELIEYRDDAQGGVEAEASGRYRFRDCPEVRVELSRLRKMGPEMKFQGERGSLVWRGGAEGVIELSLDDSSACLAHQFADSVALAGVRQLEEFCQAVTGNGTLNRVSLETCSRVVSLIETSYRQRLPYHFPWENLR